MNKLPHPLYTAAQVRAMDQMAKDEYEISGTVLIERAGSALLKVMQARWPEAKNITVFCGTGNNGGDGFVLARLAHEKKLTVHVFQLGDPDHIHGDAQAALQRLEGSGVSVRKFAGSEDCSATDVFVDALLGTGFEGEINKDYQLAIDLMNQSGKKILAVDIPSGLNADTGFAAGSAVKADCTVTFVGMKRGLVTGNAAGYCGELCFDGLGIPDDIHQKQQSSAVQVLDYDALKIHLPQRAASAHKGQLGHVLLVGGDFGMSGAIRLAGEAALRTGAGRVSVATRPEHAAIISVQRPELMCHGIAHADELKSLLDKTTVVAIGPGLGTSQWAEELKAEVLSCDLPLVIDADGLNLLAKEKFKRDNWVLTPHPLEAARLLNKDVAEIQGDRFFALDQIIDQFGGVAILKGSGSLVGTKDTIAHICNEGNPGMASGGMGDVLTGVIAGLIAQGLSLIDAAQLAVVIHARAADMAVAAVGERGLLASDLMVNLRRLVNP